MAAPRIEYDTSGIEDKAIDFEQEPGGFEVRPITRVGTSRAQTAAFKSSHFGTEDQIIITETGEDGARLNELMVFWREYAALGSSFKVIRDRDLAFFMPFQQKSIKDINGIAGTFTRALTSGLSHASYYDPFDDKVKFAADVVDTPRFTDGPGGQTDGAIKMQAGSGNLINPDLSNVSWAGATATVTKDTPEIDDPRGLGLFEAAKVELTGSNGSIAWLDTGVAVAANGSYSFYVKPLVSGQTIQLMLSGTGGGSVSKNTTPGIKGPDGQGWTRIDLEWTGSPLTTNYQPQVRGVDSGDIFYVWGPQIETATQLRHPTAYINVQTLARNTEKLLIPGAENIFNKRLKGTIGFWVRPMFDPSRAFSALLFDVADSSGVRFMHLELANGAALRGQIIDADGLNRWDITFSSPVFVHNKNWDNLIVVTWDLTIDNEYRFYHNGVFLGQETGQVGFTPTWLDAGSIFSIGSGNSGTFVAMCDFAKFFVRRNVLPLNRIQNLYNLPTHLYEQRNEWPKCILSETTIEPVQTDGAGRWRFQLIVEEVT